MRKGLQRLVKQRQRAAVARKFFPCGIGIFPKMFFIEKNGLKFRKSCFFVLFPVFRVGKPRFFYFVDGKSKHFKTDLPLFFAQIQFAEFFLQRADFFITFKIFPAFLCVCGKGVEVIKMMGIIEKIVVFVLTVKRNKAAPYILYHRQGRGKSVYPCGIFAVGGKIPLNYQVVVAVYPVFRKFILNLCGNVRKDRRNDRFFTACPYYFAVCAVA